MKNMVKAESKSFMFYVRTGILKGRGVVGDRVSVNCSATVIPNEEKPIYPTIAVDTENPLSIKVHFSNGANEAFLEWDNASAGPRIRPEYGQLLSATITGTIVEVEPSKILDNEIWTIAGHCRFSI